jgi:putative ABC transport system ATP-binding protein
VFFTYLRRELRRRARQAAFIALGLALGIGLVITVTAAAAGVRNAQATVLHSLYGLGTDITVAKAPPKGSGGTGSFPVGGSSLRHGSSFSRDALTGASRLTSKVNMIYVAAASATDISAVQAEISSLLPAATVTTSASLASQITGSLAGTASLANGLGRWLAIAVLVAAFALASLLTSTAMSQRIREFGTLKALGWRSRRIVGQVLGESLVTGGVGAAAGTGLGFGGAALIAAIAPRKNATIGQPITISDGEWLAIQGPTGHGKTTLLQLLGGLDRPTAGTIELDGTDFARLPETRLTRVRARSIGFIFQTFNLIPTLSALENVETALVPEGVRPAQRRDRAAAALASVALAERARHLPAELSGGQQQRVAIARALVKQPTVLLADEPTGNLDENTRDEIIDVLAQLCANSGLTLVMVTHDSTVAARARRTALMRDGQLTISDRSPQEHQPGAAASQHIAGPLRPGRAAAPDPSP